MRITTIQNIKYRSDYNNLTGSRQSKDQVNFGHKLFLVDENKYLEKFENNYKSTTLQHSFLYRYITAQYGRLKEIIDIKHPPCKIPWEEININTNTLFLPNYFLSKAKEEQYNHKLQELFNTDIQRVRGNLKIDPEQFPEPDFEKFCKKIVLAASPIASLNPVYEDKMSLLRRALFGRIVGHTSEKYALMRDVLSPIIVRRKFVDFANGSKGLGTNNINDKYQYLAVKKFIPIPRGVLLYGNSAAKEDVFSALYNYLPDDQVKRYHIKDMPVAQLRKTLQDISDFQYTSNNKHTFIDIDSNCIKDNNSTFHNWLWKFFNDPQVDRVTFLTNVDNLDDIHPDYLQKFDKQIEIKKLEKSDLAEAIYNHLANNNLCEWKEIYSSNSGETLNVEMARNAASELAEQIEKNNWDFSQADLRVIVLELSKKNKHFTCQDLYNAINNFISTRNH